MDRRDTYTGQLVTEQDVDEWFDDAERADRNIISDLGLVGIFDGLNVTQDAGVQNMTVEVSPGGAHAPGGERMRSASIADINCAVDRNGVTTSVVTPGNHRYITIVMSPERILSNPKTDASGQPVYYTRTESYKFEVVQGDESSGTPTPPTKPTNSIILADILLEYGQELILDEHIDYGRRQYLFNVSSTRYSLTASSIRDAVSNIVARISSLIEGLYHNPGDTYIPASNVMYGGSGLVSTFANGVYIFEDTRVEHALDFLVAVLGSVGATEGASYIGVTTSSSAVPTSLPAGTLSNRLDALRLASNLYYAGSPAFADATTLAAGSLEGAIDAFVTALAGAAGASKIGYAGSGNFADLTAVAAGSLEAAVDSLVSMLASTAGAAKIGAAASSGLVSGTVRTQLDQIWSVASSVASALGSHVTGPSDVWVPVRSPMHAEEPAVAINQYRLRIPAGGSFASDANIAWQVLDIPAGTIIDGIRVWVSRLTSTMPTGKLSWRLYRRTLSTGGTTQITSHNDTTDGSAYQNNHAAELEFDEHTVLAGNVYYIELHGEYGADAAQVTWGGSEVRATKNGASYLG